MKCPFCGEYEDRVVDSRTVDGGLSIRRRRECVHCAKRFTTYERVDEIIYMVIKKNGEREVFDRSKLLSGLIKACEKRPISIGVLEEITDEVEGMLSQSSGELTTREIGDHILERLRELDPLAYIRFASVYLAFDDITELAQELKQLLRKKKSLRSPTLQRKNLNFNE